MMQNTTHDERAVATQIGFVINTGIMMTFIALMLFMFSGDVIESSSTEDEVEMVANEIEANLIEADRVAQVETGQSGYMSAFFEPPASGVDYTARIDNSTGDLTVRSDDEVATRALQVSVGGDMELCVDSDLETRGFTQDDDSVIVEYGPETSCTGDFLEVDVQRGATREAPE